MISKLILCNNIKLDKSYTNVLNYSVEQMLELVNANKTAETTKASFINYIDNKINVDFGYDVCVNSNYLAFQNPLYSNKWFFAFIDDVEFRSEKNSIISFAVDVWSTWHNQIDFKPCFVEREHVNDDTVGLHTIDEGLACNNFICNGQQYDPNYTGNGWVAVITTYDPETNTDFTGVGLYSGNYSAGFIHLWRYTIDTLQELYKYLQYVAYKGKKDSIQSMIFIPEFYITSNLLIEREINESGLPALQTTYYQLKWTANSKKFITEISDNLGYTPKNNKCRCYPYHFLRVTNNAGSTNIYKYEFFEKNENDLIEFENQYAVTIGGSSRLIPLNYQGVYKNIDEGIELAKFPTFNWSSDEYINWLTQNAVNIPVQITSNLVSGVTAGVEGNVIGSAMTLSGTAGNIIGQFYKANLLPNRLSGTNTGDISNIEKTIRFDFYNMRLIDEELEIIDNYFSRFGYKINKTKIPNITGRLNFNYVQIGSSESLGTGNIPAKYFETINNTARRGFTVWHNHINLGNYNVNNPII